MIWPSIEEVEQADREQVCRWWRFLPCARTEKERKVIEAVSYAYDWHGGITPEISKKIGWEE